MTDSGRAADRMPRWAAPALYAVLTVVLFREFVFSDLMLFGQDTLGLGYAARAFFADALRTTGFPLWNPLILGGTPFIDALSGGDSLYPPSIALLFLTETYRALGWKLVLHVFLAGCFMYGWIRVLGGSRGAALVAGAIYLLAPYFVTLVYPGHDGKIFVTALTPLLFWVSEWMLSRKDLLPAAALSGVVALAILTTHFQAAYLLFGAVGLYMAFRCAQVALGGAGWPAGIRRFAIFVAFSVAGAGIAAIQLVPAVHYVTEYSRRATTTEQDDATSLAYSASWSMHPEEAVSLVVPEFVGSDAGSEAWTTGTYWGRNDFKLNHEYVGLVAVLLALIAFTGGPLIGFRWFMAGLGALAFLFTLGGHTIVWRLAYEVLPGISLFRAPSIAIFVTGFAVTTLAGVGVDRGLELLSRGDSRRVLGRLGIATGVLGVLWILAVTGVLEAAWLSVLRPGIDGSNLQALERARPHIQRGFLIATALAGLVGLVWWLLDRRILAPMVACGALVILVTVDEMRVDAPFIQTFDFQRWAAIDPNDQFLIDRAAAGPPFRVFSMSQPADVTPTIFGLELAAGHHPNDLARYREFIGMIGSGEPANLMAFDPTIMGILNIEYVIWPVSRYGAFPLRGIEPESNIRYADGTEIAVFRYPPIPRVRVVGDALVVPDDQTMATILDPQRYDPTRATVLTEDPPIELAGADVEGEVTWIERTPNRLVFDIEASGPALAVLSENWYPAWKATVDGEESPVLRADHTFRAVAVPAGLHRVEFRYRSSLLLWSGIVSLLSLAFLGALTVASVARARNDRASPSGAGNH